MIRVLHAIGSMAFGGAESLLMNLYRAMPRDSVQFDFAVNSAVEQPFDAEIAALGGRVMPHPEPALHPHRYARTLRRTLAVSGPYSAVHSHLLHFSGLVLTIARSAGVPHRIAHAHSTSDGRPDSLSRRFYRFTMQRLILSSATSLLACSRPAASYLFGDGIDADPRFRFFPNAIDPACYLGAGLTEDAEEIFPREDAPSFVVGHVGSFRPAKNHKFLLQVFAALLRRIPHARLLLVGGGSGLGAARALAVALGVEHAVRFLGPRPDVPRLLRQMDLLLLPSLYEGMPTVLIEAQATGIPCVVSASVTREADLGLGLLRYLCLTESTETWADQCLHAIDTRRPTDLARLQAVRDSGYDIRQAAARLEGLYV